MGRKRLVFHLSPFEREELESIVKQPGQDPGMVRRCRIVLMTEEGVPLQEIADRLGLSKTTANNWRQIFLKRRMDGLKSGKRTGRPRKLCLSSLERKELENVIMQAGQDPEMVRRCTIILMTEKGLPLHEIADRLGLSKTTANNWRQIFLKRRMDGLKSGKRAGRPRKLRENATLEGLQL